MTDFGLLVLRLTVGTLLAGHGSQKLFGWFGGRGLQATHGMMEKLGMKPGKVWGTTAALGEFAGGVLTALGFLNPLGPLNIAAAMTVATRRVHWGKPIWNSAGGAELPLTNFAAAATLTLTGPGRYSVDRLLGFRLPRWLAAITWIATVATTVAALRRPEVAETILEKAEDLVASAPFVPARSPEVEVETRPRTEADQPATT